MEGFVNRRKELEVLKEKLGSDRFELIVVYGRRRIGKTRLVLEAVKDVPHVYYLAVEGENLKHFRQAASKLVPEIVYAREDWEAYMSFLKDKVVVIDEFPNLVKESPRVLSLFQRIVDTILSATRTKLILVGSSISMMKSRVLAYKSPLYGRRTGSIKLGPLGFLDLKEFFPNSSWEELVEIYGFADGIPYYLSRIETPFWNWLERELSRPDTFLKDEVDFMLKYEFAEIATYKKILEAIAYGKNTPKEIREYTGLKHSDITPYLKNLIEVDLVVREVPITETPRSKKGRYIVADNFTAFWFRYIAPNLSAIEEGILDVSEIKRDYSNYLGIVFEKVARQLLLELNRQKMLPFRFTKIGKWWHRELEVDILALNQREKKALLVEVKWSSLRARDVDRLLVRLEEKAKHIREIKDYEKYYGVVAKQAPKISETVWDLTDFSKIASQHFKRKKRKS